VLFWDEIARLGCNIRYPFLVFSEEERFGRSCRDNLDILIDRKLLYAAAQPSGVRP